jgi:hypothetical protein
MLFLSTDFYFRLYNTFLDAGEDIFRNWTKCNLFDLPDIAWREKNVLLGRKTKLFNECKENWARNQNQLLNTKQWVFSDVFVAECRYPSFEFVC